MRAANRSLDAAISADTLSPFYSDQSEQPKPVDAWAMIIDMLGFKAMLQASTREGQGHWSFRNYLNVLKATLPWLRSIGDRWLIKIYSDNILVGGPVHEDGESEYSRLADAASDFQMALALNGIFVRGGASLGALYADNTIVFGKALLDAHEMDKPGGPPRIAFSMEAVRALIVYASFQSPAVADRTLRSMHLIVGADGIWFLDYLGSICARGSRPSIDKITLSVHRDVIEKQLLVAEDPKVRAKLEWLACYHNFICDEAGDPSLKIKGFENCTPPHYPTLAEIEDIEKRYPYTKSPNHAKHLVGTINRMNIKH